MPRPSIAPTLIVIGLAASVIAAAAPGEEVDAPALAYDLDTPVDITFGPDGVLYYAEVKSGHVRALQPNGTVTEPLATVPASYGGNGGFLGLAADPDEAYVFYAYYTMEKADAPDGKVNRVVRLDLRDGSETVLVDDLPWAQYHDGGRVVVGPDGFLYVTTGDNGPAVGPGGPDATGPSQDPQDLRGKVLRVTRDGEPAPGNPEGMHPMVFALGFRNPFGIEVAPDGRVFASDNGGDEEVNLVEVAGNYGWPMCAGPCEVEGTSDPFASWSEQFGPTGVAIHDGTLFLGDFVYSRVRTVDLATRDVGIYWEGDTGGVLDVEVGSDDCLYVSTWSAIHRAPLGDRWCSLAEYAPPPPPAADDDPIGEDAPDDPVVDDDDDTFAGPEDDVPEDAGSEGFRIPAPAALPAAAFLAAAAVLGRRVSGNR